MLRRCWRTSSNFMQVGPDWYWRCARQWDGIRGSGVRSARVQLAKQCCRFFRHAVHSLKAGMACGSSAGQGPALRRQAGMRFAGSAGLALFPCAICLLPCANRLPTAVSDWPAERSRNLFAKHTTCCLFCAVCSAQLKLHGKKCLQRRCNLRQQLLFQ